MAKIKNRDLYIIIVVAVLIVVVLVGISLKQKNPTDNQNTQQQSQQENKPTETEKTEQTPVTTTKTTTPTVNLSYQEALTIYAGKVFQFSFDYTNNCVIAPTASVAKAGTGVMLDNRSDKEITVYVDGMPFSLAAYTFKIVTLTASRQLPYTVNISCKNGRNNAQIILQQ